MIIEHDPSICKGQQDLFTVCTYFFYAAGNDKTETSKYHIEAVRTEATMLLVEGDAKGSQIDKTKCQYYKFNIFEATSI